MPDTDQKGAAAVAARCREALADIAIPHQSSAVGPTVTISIGAGTIVPSLHDQVMQFIEQIDRRLYRAKQSGRNAVVESE